MKLSEKAKKLPASGIRAMFALAEKYDHPINLCIGEPGFATPQHIIDKGCWAWNHGYTKYVSNPGMAVLREAVAEKLNRENGFSVKPENVIITFGANQALFSALQVALNPGDEVLVPNPCFANYFGYIALAQAVAVPVPTYESDHFHVKAANLEKYITDKTRMVIINSPCNPTGSVTPKEDLIEIAGLAKKHDLIVVADEPYEHILFDGSEHFSIATLPGMFERTITANGFSKTYAMTGWRIGYLLAGERIAKVMANYLSHSTGSPSSVSQAASVAALNGPQDCVETMRRAFEERRNYIVDRVNAIDGVSCIKPEGAFYIMMNVEKQLGRTIHGELIQSGDDFSAALLKHGLVATVPCSGFGAPNFVRWSYATSMDNIKKGMDRLEEFLKG